MSKSNKLLRSNAKIEYKKLMKNIPKGQRPSFSQVYKRIRQSQVAATKTLPTGEVVAPVTEDVDMSELDDLFVEAIEDTNETSSS